MESLSTYITHTLRQMDIGFHGEPIIGTIGGFPHCALLLSSESFLFLIRYLSEDKSVLYDLEKDLRPLLFDESFFKQYEQIFGKINGQHWYYSCKSQTITYSALSFESTESSQFLNQNEMFYQLCCRLGKDLIYCFMLKMQNDFVSMIQESKVSNHQKILENFLFSSNPIRQRNLNLAAIEHIKKTPLFSETEKSKEVYDLSGMFTPEFIRKTHSINWLEVLDSLNDKTKSNL